ncbi:hypothetical protein crov388 [Cafeteria roenbergensis virus]|uniref:Uncharacterized protein n=1 Tax=Cafeteria roenbergensis virus (strain BV-PW1) TaxID=693272 RepID=E3T5F9_CROVB|nr:hypothetical protein crov388 [Cafeteria roenbergensis virus BV-PW1]ADO67422.1 hypothetical protein crov388 [Cafeteria roenbergensis virus BV-PW1]
MDYQFKITTTGTNIIEGKLKLDTTLTLEQLKLKLVGPIIYRIGLDKIKFFQRGKIYDDDERLYRLINTEPIMIHTSIVPLKNILIKSLMQDEPGLNINTNNDDDNDDDDIFNDFSYNLPPIQSHYQSHSDQPQHLLHQKLMKHTQSYEHPIHNKPYRHINQPQHPLHQKLMKHTQSYKHPIHNKPYRHINQPQFNQDHHQHEQLQQPHRYQSNDITEDRQQFFERHIVTDDGVDDHEPILDLKTPTELEKEMTETLQLFSKETITKLMDIYLNNKEEFMEFINYISKGHYNEVSSKYKMEYSSEIYGKIRDTFPMFKSKTNEEIKQELDKYGGNLDIMISHNF